MPVPGVHACGVNGHSQALLTLLERLTCRPALGYIVTEGNGRDDAAMHTDLVVLPHDVALVPRLDQDRVLEHLGHTSGREALEFCPDFRVPVFRRQSFEPAPALKLPCCIAGNLFRRLIEDT